MVPAQTSYMFLYDNLLNSWLPRNDSTPLVAGMVARTVVSTCLSPVELLRTRLQSTPSDPSKPHTVSATIRGIAKMARTNGPFSLWRGLSATLWRDVPFSGMYWVGYEYMKAGFGRRGYEGAPVAFVSGATSGICAALITSPFDTLKTRRQTMIYEGTKSGTGTYQIVRDIVRNEGGRALFAGLTPRLAKIAPACGIMIACYEVSK